jgi:ABC-type transporter Mla subunit MlaD
MPGKVGRNWTPAQKAAVTDELQAHILGILEQAARLTQEVQDKLKLVEELTDRLAGHCDPEDGLPF